MKPTIHLLTLLFPLLSWGFTFPDCEKSSFNYRLRQDGENIVFTYAGGADGSVTRELVDDDGVLTTMAVYRSWQTRQTDILPSSDVRLLRSALTRAQQSVREQLAALAPENEARREVLRERQAAIQALSEALDPTATQRFAQVKTPLQRLLKTTYQTRRSTRGFTADAYQINSSDGSSQTLFLCTFSGISGGGCLGSAAANKPECQAGVWNDFCGVNLEEVEGDAIFFHPSRVEMPVTTCHPQALGEQVFGGSTPAVAPAKAKRQ